MFDVVTVSGTPFERGRRHGAGGTRVRSVQSGDPAKVTTEAGPTVTARPSLDASEESAKRPSWITNAPSASSPTLNKTSPPWM